MNVNQARLPRNVNIEYGVAMHCGVNGHNKDWVGVCTDTMIYTFWGKANLMTQSGQRLGDRRYLERIVQDKINKGYIIVDNFVPSKTGGCWNSQLSAPQPKPEAPPKAKRSPFKAELPSIIDKAAKPDEAIGWDF